jgi:osmotically-inducible protein OsmY
VDRSQDERIRQEVSARLAAEPSLDATNLRVEVDGGVVLLHGGVSGMGAWQCAISTSGLVRGVRSVVDYLVIGRGPRDVRCLAPRPDTAVIPGR